MALQIREPFYDDYCMLQITATEYEIRRGLEHNLSANYSVIMPGDVVQGNLSAPATAGTVEEFTVQLPKGENNLIMSIDTCLCVSRGTGLWYWQIKPQFEISSLLATMINSLWSCFQYPVGWSFIQRFFCSVLLFVCWFVYLFDCLFDCFFT